jgi:hypothetical protein
LNHCQFDGRPVIGVPRWSCTQSLKVNDRLSLPLGRQSTRIDVVQLGTS